MENSRTADLTSLLLAAPMTFSLTNATPVSGTRNML